MKKEYFAHWILLLSVSCIALGLLWAHFAVLDEVTVGEGKVIPSRQIQVIQNLEGGIIEKIFVDEGDMVEEGQLLMQINNTRFLATFKEAEAKLELLEIQVARLSAEVRNVPFLPPANIDKNNPVLVEEQKNLMESRAAELEQLAQALKLVEKELKLTIPLVGKGAASPVEVLRLERTLAELKGKIQQFKSQSLEQLNKARGELVALQGSIAADKDRLKRTEVRSPVKGIVNQIKVNTVGGVIQPGMDILEIVPVDDTLLIEAKIKPADIGFIAPNQEAMVKITAYDFARYGGLKGKVVQISADAISEEEDEGKSYYIVRIRTQKNYIGSPEKPMYIIPGMMASVDILTGHKTVLDYLLKPVFTAQEKALRER